MYSSKNLNKGVIDIDLSRGIVTVNSD